MATYQDLLGVIQNSFKIGLSGLTINTATGNVSVTWPATNGSSGQVLTNDGVGNLSWSSSGQGASVFAGDLDAGLITEVQVCGLDMGYASVLSSACIDLGLTYTDYGVI
jgi:hypothetical protein